MENNRLVSDQTEVCNILNDLYINIAKEIGIDNQSADHIQVFRPKIIAPLRALNFLFISNLSVID